MEQKNVERRLCSSATLTPRRKPMFKLKNRYMHFNRIFAVGVAAVMSIVGVTFFAGDEKIHACRCIELTPSEDAFDGADVVFLGKAVEIAFATTGPTIDVVGDPKIVKFSVGKAWKGTAYDTMFVATRNSLRCDGYDFTVGRQYLVYAHAIPDHELWVDLCSGTSSAPNAQERGYLDHLGEGWTPEPGSIAPTPTPIPSPTPTPSPSPIPSPTPMPTATGGNCNILAPSAHADFVVKPGRRHRVVRVPSARTRVARQRFN